MDTNSPNPRVASELEGIAVLDMGVDVRVVRLPQVHDTVKQGLISPYIDIARQKGVVAYVGDGANCWPAAHVSDVARATTMRLCPGWVQTSPFSQSVTISGHVYDQVIVDQRETLRGARDTLAEDAVDVLALGSGLSIEPNSTGETLACSGQTALTQGIEQVRANSTRWPCRAPGPR